MRKLFTIYGMYNTTDALIYLGNKRELSKFFREDYDSIRKKIDYALGNNFSGFLTIQGTEYKVVKLWQETTDGEIINDYTEDREREDNDEL